MPQYLCTQRTSLPTGGLATVGQVYELPEECAHQGSWKALNQDPKQNPEQAPQQEPEQEPEQAKPTAKEGQEK